VCPGKLKSWETAEGTPRFVAEKRDAANCGKKSVYFFFSLRMFRQMRKLNVQIVSIEDSYWRRSRGELPGKMIAKN
jgi:hypothetical protein